MSDEHSSSQPQEKTWLSRLSHALLGEPTDRNELITLLRSAEQRALLDADALAMIEGALSVNEMQVRDIMIPRSHMVVVERDAALDALIPILLNSGHSRFPVIGEDRDDVQGILLAKDLLNYTFGDAKANFDITDVVRSAVFVPESKRLNILLKEFRSNRYHMAMVVDEYGGVAGLVTIEDVLEQIVGEIEDEHDLQDDDLQINALDNGCYLVNALLPIGDFNAYFSTTLDDTEYDTLGGLISHQFGHMPRRGERLTIDNFEFKVILADQRRIKTLQILPIPESSE